MASTGARLVRRPAVAGTFYPGTEDELRNNVHYYLNHEIEPLSDVVGIVAPHAGYMFSGKVAGTVYGAVRELSPETIVLIGPSHFEYFEGICVYEGDAFQTPLGEVPVDTEFRERLVQAGNGIFAGIQGHGSNGQGEHCLEVQLPFLQELYDEFAIVPVIMGEQDWPTCEALAGALAEVCSDRNCLIIASSDLSHYHSYEVAQVIDARFIEMLQRGEPEALAEALEKREVEACGGGPVVATQLASQRLGADKTKVLLYQNSGDVWVDKTRVVGYLAAAFTRNHG